MKRALGLLAIWLACALVGIVAWVWMAAALAAKSHRGWIIAIAFDQLGNAATGGSEDETVSSRAARGRDQGIWRWCLLCKLLDAIDPGHCDRARGT